MKKLTPALFPALSCVSAIIALQNPTDAPATKEHMQKYLDAMHSHEMIHDMVEAMSKPMRQMKFTRRI